MKTYIEWNLTEVVPVPLGKIVLMLWDREGAVPRFGECYWGEQYDNDFMILIEGSFVKEHTMPKWWADPGLTCPNSGHGFVDAGRELDNWKRLAAYFCEVHAATAEEMLRRKSASKSDKQRLLNICMKASTSLQRAALVGVMDRSETADGAVQVAVSRCQEAADHHL